MGVADRSVVHHAVDQAVAQVIDEAEGLGRDDPAAALCLLADSVPRQLRREDPGLSARAAYLRAQLLCVQGAYDAALGAIRSARRDWLAADERLEALRTDLGRATVLHEIGEYVQSADASQRLLAELSRLQLGPEQQTEADSVRARANSNLANAWIQVGALNDALHHYDLAGNLFESLGEPDKLAETDANRGLVHLRLGMVHQALDELRGARDALQRLGLRLAAAKCTSDIAEAHLQLNQEAVAIAEMQACRPTLEELNAVPEQARLALTLSRALLQAGLVDRARAEALHAADVFAELSMIGESARATMISATASMSLGDPDRARQEFAAAERLFADCGDETKVAEVWFAEAQLARRSGDTPAAARHATSAAERLEDKGVLFPATLARLMLADLSPDAGEAAAHLARAIELAQTLRIPSLRFVASLGRARQCRRAGDLPEAAQILRDLLDAEQGDSDPTHDPRLRIAHHAARAEATDELVEVLLAQGTHRSLTEAWQQATRAQSQVLNEFVAAVHRSPGTDGEEDRTGDPSGSWDLSMLSLLRDELPGHEPEPLPASMSCCADPRPHRLSRDLPSPAGSSQSAPLPAVPEGPVLQYHVLGEDIVAFAVREGVVHARRIPGATGMTRALVEEWRTECTRSSLRNPAGPVDTGAADRILTQLHDLLIGPVAELVDDLADEPLLVLPHRHLHAVPFEALHAGDEPLSTRFRLRFALGLATTPAPAPAYDSTDTLVLAVPDDRAPAIAEEARAIARLRRDAEVVTGGAATTRALAEAASGRGVVHLACHGWFRATNPLSSCLRLADRWITAREIVELDLSGSLVVLSACSSGEASASMSGPTGLAWAFLAAGARAVIASNWVLDDRTAVELMPRLHADLTAGATPAQALDTARRAVARTRPHPYHWGSFRYLCSPATALTEGTTP